MKKNSILWAALSMTAALVMTACSNDDNDMTEAPVAPSTSKTIPYTVTVGGDDAITRATVNDDPDNRILYFAEGDKLYITGTDIQGVLEIQDGIGNASGATFSGNLTYSGEGSPAANLELSATLVSAQQEGTNKISVDATTGAVTVNYPKTAYCADVATAVQEYSRLTGTCEYADRAFTLTQQTAFLNFVITFEDGTATGTALSAVVNNNSSNICSASVTTVTDNGVKAKFVLPVAAGTTLSSAKVTMGSKAAISFGASQTLEGKVYNVKKTQAYTMAAAATSADKGKLICADGHIHAYGADAACTKARVAKIIYIGTTGHATYSHGLALALTDEGQMAWGAAMTACDSKNTSTPVTGATWLLASQAQWNYMLGASGAGGYEALRDGFSSVGGSNLQSGYYYSSTEEEDGRVSRYHFSQASWSIDYKDRAYVWVRACLAF